MRVLEGGITSLPLAQESIFLFPRRLPIFICLEFCSSYHSVNTIAEIQVFYSQRKGTKVICMRDMDEFLSIEDNDDDVIEVEPSTHSRR